MAGLGVADWTPREPHQGYPDGLKAPAQKAREPSRRSTTSGSVERAGHESSSVSQGQQRKQSTRGRRNTDPGSPAAGSPPLVPRPPGGEYRQVSDGWYVSELSQDWLYKPATGIHFHCPTETLWRKAKGGHGFVQVDRRAGLESVALAALGDTAVGQRTLLRACFLSWGRQRHKFDDMDKDLAEGVAAETSLQSRPRLSAPRTADRGDGSLAGFLEPAVAQLSSFVAGMSDGASSALAAASKGATEAVAQAAAAAQASARAPPAGSAQATGAPASSASSRSSSAMSGESSSSAGSWKPKHAAPALVVRRREPPARSKPSTSASQRKSSAQPSGQYLGAVTLPSKLPR